MLLPAAIADRLQVRKYNQFPIRNEGASIWHDDENGIASGTEVKLAISLPSLKHFVRVKYDSNSNDLCFSLFPRNRRAVIIK